MNTNKDFKSIFLTVSRLSSKVNAGNLALIGEYSKSRQFVAHPNAYSVHMNVVKRLIICTLHKTIQYFLRGGGAGGGHLLTKTLHRKTVLENVDDDI